MCVADVRIELTCGRWESLEEKPVEGQWTYFDRPSN